VLTVDFEASCLPRHGRSFPIEVGIADASGRTWSWLIKPEPEWLKWDWTREAELLHGISLRCLVEEGHSSSEVMRQLNAVAGGQRVIADHYLDAQWLQTLSAGAGLPPDFRIEHVSGVIEGLQPPSSAVERAIAASNALVPRRHRAGPDALWLAMFLSRLSPSESEGSIFGWQRPIIDGLRQGPMPNSTTEDRSVSDVTEEWADPLLAQEASAIPPETMHNAQPDRMR
jgi:hypothetical protein